MTVIFNDAFQSSINSFNCLEKKVNYGLDKTTDVLVKVLPTDISELIKNEYRVEARTNLLWYGVSYSLNFAASNPFLPPPARVLAGAVLVTPLIVLAVKNTFKHIKTCQNEMEDDNKRIAVAAFLGIAAWSTYINLSEGIYPHLLRTLPGFIFLSNFALTLPLIFNCIGINDYRHSPLRIAERALPELEEKMRFLSQVSWNFQQFISLNPELKNCLNEHLEEDPPEVLRDFREMLRGNFERNSTEEVEEYVLARLSNLSFDIARLSRHLDGLMEYIRVHPRLYESFRLHVVAARNNEARENGVRLTFGHLTV